MLGSGDEIRLGSQTFTVRVLPRTASEELEDTPAEGFRPPRSGMVTIESDAGLKRRHPRYQVILPLRYSSEALTLEAVALDLSVGGVFIGAGRFDEVAAACTIHISASAERPPTATAFHAGQDMIFRGHVRSQATRNHLGMGIEFDALSDRQRTWIEKQVQQAPIQRSRVD